MKRVHPLIVIVGLIVVGAFWQIGMLLLEHHPITNYPPKAGKVLAFGDSLVVGVGNTNEAGGFVGILSRRLETTITSRGVSGDTTTQGLLRIEQDVLAEQPAIVIILLGGNDYLKRIPMADTFVNLRKIIARVQDSGATVLLLGVRGGLIKDRFDSEFAKLADESGVIFVPNVLDGVIGNATLMSDQVHPNDAGYMKIADKIAPSLLGLIEAQRQHAITR